MRMFLMHKWSAERAERDFQSECIPLQTSEEVMEHVQRMEAKLGKSLELKSYEQQCRELGRLRLENRRLRGTFSLGTTP